jgi:hypothetical protein
MSPPYDAFVVDVGDRLAAASPRARAAHREVLMAFAETGRAPDPSQFAPEVLAELHDRDLVRSDDAGEITVAYPFSGMPTAHVVEIQGGPTVYSMCALGALGLGSMLGRDTTIRSADPYTGQLSS